MKKIIILLIAIVILIAGFAFFRNSAGTNGNDAPPPPGNIDPPPPENVTIRMNDGGYEPEDLTISVGTTITFVNEGGNEHWPASNIHPTHQIYSEFDPKQAVPPGGSWSFTFDKVGIWRWHDHLFPTLKGTIVVE